MISIAIVGASKDRSKFGNKAVRAYVSKGYTVYPIHPKEKEIEGLKTYARLSELPYKPDIVSLYVPPEIGVKIADDIIKLKIQDIRINPGAESDELIAKLEKAKLKPKCICSILAIGINPAML